MWMDVVSLMRVVDKRNGKVIEKLGLDLD